MVSKPLPRSKGDCPDCGGRLRQNRKTGILKCEKCEWSNKKDLEEDRKRRSKQKAENFKERRKRKGNIKPKNYYQ